MIGCSAKRISVTDGGVGCQGERIDGPCSAGSDSGIHLTTTKWNMMSKCPCCKWSLVGLIVPGGDSMGYICVANVGISDIRVANKRVVDIIRVAGIGVDDTRAA